MVYIEFSAIFLITLIVLCERVSVEVRYFERLSLKISFIFFAVELFPEKKRKKSRIKFKNRILILRSVLPVGKYFIGKCFVTVRSFDISFFDLTENIFLYVLLAVLPYPGMGVISNITRGVGGDDGGTYPIDFKIEFLMFHLFISVLLVPYYVLKNLFVRCFNVG